MAVHNSRWFELEGENATEELCLDVLWLHDEAGCVSFQKVSNFIQAPWGSLTTPKNLVLPQNMSAGMFRFAEVPSGSSLAADPLL